MGGRELTENGVITGVELTLVKGGLRGVIVASASTDICDGGRRRWLPVGVNIASLSSRGNP
jgi:hypothetical protein